MNEQRLNKLENAMTDMAEKFSEFLSIESARKERDKHQVALNEKMSDFMETYKSHDKPVIETSRKWQGWFFWWLTRLVLPAILAAVLIGAGAEIYEKAPSKHIKHSEKKVDNE